MTHKRPNIQDIATLSGVGRGTVSRVLNDQSGVSAEKREKVLQAVEQLNYRPSASARQLRTQRSHTIGFITDYIATTPFAGNIVKGAQDAAWEQGHILLMVNTGGKAEVEQTAVEVMLERQVEGIIYAAMYHREVTLPPNIRHTHCVLLDCFTADPAISSVVPDEIGGGYEATRILIEKGHRRIAFINLDPKIALSASVKRLEGYQRALVDFAIPFDPTLISYGNAQADGGYEKTHALMKHSDPPSAIFCGNDRMAMGCYTALQELGKAIPADVAVIGFDNQKIIAKYLRPTLSTMSLPHYGMGRWAVEELLRQTANLPPDSETTAPPHPVPIQQVLACRYVERDSV